MTARRRGESAEDGSWVRVGFAHTEVVGRGIVVGPPKSRAGRDRADVVEHLRIFVGPDPAALVFTGEKGKALRRSNSSQRADWPRLVSTIGVTGLHFHDLRHAANVWAAQTGQARET